MGGGGTPAPAPLAGDGDDDVDVDDDEGAQGEVGIGREPGCGAGGKEAGSVEVEGGCVPVGVYSIFPDVLVLDDVDVGAGVAGAPGLAAG